MDDLKQYFTVPQVAEKLGVSADWVRILIKKKHLRAKLLIGLAWVAFGMISLETNESVRWTDYGYLVVGLLYLGHYWADRTWQYLTIENGVIGLLYIGHYLHDRANQYLTIENGTIRKNGLYGLGRKINLQDVYWIKKFAGDYTLKTQQGDLKIDTDLIDAESLADLNKVLSALDLPPEKTPFAELA